MHLIYGLICTKYVYIFNYNKRSVIWIYNDVSVEKKSLNFVLDKLYILFEFSIALCVKSSCTVRRSHVWFYIKEYYYSHSSHGRKNCSK